MQPTDAPTGRQFPRASQLLAGVAVAVSLLVPASAFAQSATTVAVLRGPGLADAAGQVIVWSERTSSSPDYRLRSWRDGRVRTLPVKARSAPFDLDLGRDRTGRQVVTFSRCVGQRPTQGGAFVQLRRARRCTLRVLDLRSGRESALGPRQPSDQSRFYPSLWRGRLVFAQTNSHAAYTTGPLPHVFEATNGRARDLGYGYQPHRNPDVPQSEGVTGTDVRGSTAAFGWEAAYRGDPSGMTAFSEVWASRNGQRARRVAAPDSQTGGPTRAVAAPTLLSGGLRYLALGQYLSEGDTAPLNAITRNLTGTGGTELPLGLVNPLRIGRVGDLGDGSTVYSYVNGAGNTVIRRLPAG